MPEQPAPDQLGLGGAVVVKDQMHFELGRDLLLDVLQEAFELAGAMAPVKISDHPSAGDVEGGEQRGGAVPTVVVGAALGKSGAMGRMGWVRSRAWIWLFSSTQRTMARSGGSM
jgi:hypothetical protein